MKDLIDALIVLILAQELVLFCTQRLFTKKEILILCIPIIGILIKMYEHIKK
jgi:uncharacterized membrane protein